LSNVCTQKDLVGLSILDLDISKWLFRRMNEDGVWQDPRNKYLRKIIIQVEHMSRDSQLWYGLLTVKANFLRPDHFKLANGPQIRFWKDK
jgi:hypothetical protein